MKARDEIEINLFGIPHLKRTVFFCKIKVIKCLLDGNENVNRTVIFQIERFPWQNVSCDLSSISFFFSFLLLVSLYGFSIESNYHVQWQCIHVSTVIVTIKWSLYRHSHTNLCSLAYTQSYASPFFVVAIEFILCICFLLTSPSSNMTCYNKMDVLVYSTDSLYRQTMQLSAASTDADAFIFIGMTFLLHLQF